MKTIICIVDLIIYQLTFAVSAMSGDEHYDRANSNKLQEMNQYVEADLLHRVQCYLRYIDGHFLLFDVR